MDDTIFVNVTYVNAVLAFVLPALVALISRRLASPRVKALLLALLTIIAGILQEIIANDGGFEWKAAIGTMLVQFVGAVAIHTGLLKPTGITGKDGVLQRATADVGVGSTANSSTPQPPPE
jgi:stage V sporulation protein SpoVS